LRYVSTRDSGHSVPLEEAIKRGLAPDGGLYVPEVFPEPLGPEAFVDQHTFAEIGTRLLTPFFDGSILAPDLADICARAFDFPILLRPLRDRTAVLELFHGPTAAFKDVGARFLAECLSCLGRGHETPLTLLVATSGDTGGAVAAASHGRSGVEVVILYPKGMVSPRQEKQLTAWGGNVEALAVRGDFDDCQRMVKAALNDPEFRAAKTVSSANSINLGRLLPQMVSYASAALSYWREHGVKPGFVVPSGNVGNALAGMWAQRMGLPIREIVLATNANPTLTDFTSGGDWIPRPTVNTLATAMDVGNPSNMERVFQLLGGPDGARRLRAERVTDDRIREQIRRGPESWGEIWDPHTATAVEVRERIGGPDWIIVATAHPAKFEGVVEPLIGREVAVPPALAAILQRPSRVAEIEPRLDEMKRALGIGGN
jgi:threonine synthase